MKQTSVKNSVVFVTGANRRKGIGQALVKEAIQRGAKKVYATARDVSQLDDLVSKFKGKVAAIALDVADAEQIQKAAQKAADTQILINNAGVSEFSGCIYNYNDEKARKEFEINFFGPLYLMRAFSDHLIKNSPSAVVNVISIGGLMPFPMAATYSASKAALYSLTQAVRIEMHRHGIPVFGIYPGPIDTDMANGLTVEKESPANAAIRIFDGMENGIEDITTDALADAFTSYLKRDPEALEAVKKRFG